MKRVTLCFCVRPGEVLLGLHQRDFNKGNWNGYGGEVEKKETIEQAAVREVREETGIIIKKGDIDRVAILTIFWGPTPKFECHTFITRTWVGEPQPTEEMNPHQWFSFHALPFKQMRKADALWLPKILQEGAKLQIYIQNSAQGNELETIRFLPLLAEPKIS